MNFIFAITVRVRWNNDSIGLNERNTSYWKKLRLGSTENLYWIFVSCFGWKPFSQNGSVPIRRNPNPNLNPKP